MAISLGGTTDTLLNLSVFLLSSLVIGGLLFMVIFAYMQNKRYKQFKVIIWGKDAFNQLIQKEDGAGIFVDRKTNNKRFFLKKHNVGLQPDNVPYIQKGNEKIVYLLQTGLKNFRFIKPVISEDVFTFDVKEEDVNWAVNSYERGKKLFSQNWLMQYLPFIMLAFVSIVILVIFIYFFKNFAVLKETAIAFQNAAGELAKANAMNVNGTFVLT